MSYQLRLIFRDKIGKKLGQIETGANGSRLINGDVTVCDCEIGKVDFSFRVDERNESWAYDLGYQYHVDVWIKNGKQNIKWKRLETMMIFKLICTPTGRKSARIDGTAYDKRFLLNKRHILYPDETDGYTSFDNVPLEDIGVAIATQNAGVGATTANGRKLDGRIPSLKILPSKGRGTKTSIKFSKNDTVLSALNALAAIDGGCWQMTTEVVNDVVCCTLAYVPPNDPARQSSAEFSDRLGNVANVQRVQDYTRAADTAINHEGGVGGDETCEILRGRNYDPTCIHCEMVTSGDSSNGLSGLAARSPIDSVTFGALNRRYWFCLDYFVGSTVKVNVKGDTRPRRVACVKLVARSGSAVTVQPVLKIV